MLFLVVCGYAQKQSDTNPSNDVMLQGFWRSSYADPEVIKAGGLYVFLQNQAEEFSNAGFDLVWTPPPSKGDGLAYFPTELYNFNNAHGTELQLRSMLSEFKKRGIHGMADVVANHRNGTTMWSDFTNPDWGCEVIVANDEVDGQLGQVQPCGDIDEGEGFEGARDMNHQSLIVQEGYKTYLNKLKEMGFDSWRWDFTKGFPAKYVGTYNASSTPYFSVGENWEGNPSVLKNWVNASGYSLDGLVKKSATLDFALYYHLVRAVTNNHWSELQNAGLIGQNGFSQYAVTFAQNHDVDDIKGNSAIMKANAYILTHNGIPMVFLKHWIANTQKINELIAVRKQNQINASSNVRVVEANDKYVAYIDEKVVVKIGADQWSPGNGWILNTFGDGYAVWSKIVLKK